MIGGIIISAIKLAMIIMACGLLGIMGTAMAASPDQVMGTSWNAEYTEHGQSASPWQPSGDSRLQVMSSPDGWQVPAFGYGDSQPNADPYAAQSTTSEQEIMPGYGASDGYGSYNGGYDGGYGDGVSSTTSEQQVAGGMWGKNHDWLSPGGEVSVNHYNWYGPKKAYYSSWHPTYFANWYYPKTYHFSWYEPVIYNSWDPWWAANVHGTVTTTYYWSSSWGW